MIHKIIEKFYKFDSIKYFELMSKLSIKNQKLLVDAMIKTFKSIPPTAITILNIKKK